MSIEEQRWAGSERTTETHNDDLVVGRNETRNGGAARRVVSELRVLSEFLVRREERPSEGGLVIFQGVRREFGHPFVERRAGELGDGGA